MSISLALAFAPFAVFFLSAAAPAPKLLEVKDPPKITAVFPREATVRVVNVWATWCVPCVEEMDDLQLLAKEFKADSRFALVGVSLDDMVPDDRAKSKFRVAQFLQKKKVVFANVYYSGKTDKLGDYWNFSGEIPITMVFDRNGKELWRHQGRIDRQQTIAAIRKLLRRD